MKNTRKAFTLVELIVVITILAILGTIAFISLQGYSSDARNTKRTSDLNSLMGKISAENATGRPLMSFISNGGGNSVLATIALAGSGTEDKHAQGVYDAGNPNYTSLGIKEEDFKDPTDKQYIIAVTTLVGGKYEIAASIEDGAGGFEAAVVGTYAPRAGTGATGAYSTDNTASVDSTNNLIVISDDAAGFFKKGDTITNGTNTTTISKVSNDGLTLTVASTTGFTASSVINLGLSEENGLIDATTTGISGDVVTDGGTYLPY